jgi:hypothetical protein
MTQDRTYFRMLSDTALAEAARYCDNDLALVLGERLHDLIDAQEDLEAARDAIKELQADIADLHAQLDAMEAEADHDTHTN